MTPDTERFLSQISTVQKVSENQNSALQDFQQAQAELAAPGDAAKADLAALAEKEKQLKSLTDASDKKLAEAKKVLAKLTAEQRRQISEAEKSDSSGQLGGPRTSREASRAPVTGSGRGAKALAYARAQLGEPYVRNGAGPSSWDCSGLTMRAWGSVGVSLPHSSGQQYNRVRHVAKSDLQLGDLVFFYNDIHHVGLYAGNGQVIHAPRRQVGGVHQDVLHALSRSRPARLSFEPLTGPSTRVPCLCVSVSRLNRAVRGLSLAALM